MNISQRHQEILNRIKEKTNISVTEIAKDLGVSEVTIRKDFNYLESKNLIFRHHGGASLNNPYVLDRPISQKQSLNTEEKSKIGENAAAFIEDNDVIILGSGTTVHSIINHIPKEKCITVITSSLLVAAKLCEFPNIQIIQLGGSVRHSSQSTVGPNAQQQMTQFSANKFFLGADGIDEEFGISTSNIEEAFLNKLMIKNSSKTFVLCDKTKFGKKGLGKICDINEIDNLITNHEVDLVYENILAKNAVNVIISD